MTRSRPLSLSSLSRMQVHEATQLALPVYPVCVRRNLQFASPPPRQTLLLQRAVKPILMGKDCIAQAQSGKGEVLTQPPRVLNSSPSRSLNHVELCVPLAKARVEASGEQQCPLRLSQQLRRESIRQRSITVVSKKNRRKSCCRTLYSPARVPFPAERVPQSSQAGVADIEGHLFLPLSSSKHLHHGGNMLAQITT